MCRAKKLYAIGIEPWSWRSDTTIWRHNQGKKTWDSKIPIGRTLFEGPLKKAGINDQMWFSKWKVELQTKAFNIRSFVKETASYIKCASIVLVIKSNIRKVMWEGQFMKLNFWAGITALECKDLWLLPTNQHCLSSHLETSDDTKLCLSNINKMHKECARTLPVNSYLPTLDCSFTEDN